MNSAVRGEPFGYAQESLVEPWTVNTMKSAP